MSNHNNRKNKQENKDNKNKKDKKEQPKMKVTVFEVDDFFTQYLDKKKQYYVSKMEKIGRLKQMKKEELKPDQLKMIENVDKTEEQIKYFDDIKQLYFKAYEKKERDQAELICPSSDLLNLFYTGNILSKLPDDRLNLLENHIPIDQQRLLRDLHEETFSSLHTLESLLEAKEKLQRAIKEEEAFRRMREVMNNGFFEIDLQECSPEEVEPKPELIKENDKNEVNVNLNEPKEGEKDVFVETEIKITSLPVGDYESEPKIHNNHNQRNNRNRRNNHQNGRRDYQNYSNRRDHGYNKGEERGERDNEYRRRREDNGNRPNHRRYQRRERPVRAQAE